MTKVLVTGATGNVGSATLRALADARVPVRAFVRAESAHRLQAAPDVEVAVGDFADPESVRQALAGIDRVVLSATSDPNTVAYQAAVIDECAAAGVELIVKISTVGAAVGSPLPNFDWHGQAEDHLRRSGVPAVIIRGSYFMTNLLALAQQVRETGLLIAPAGTGRVAMIDPRDVGAVAAAVAVGGKPAPEPLVLTGPEPVTFEQAAGTLSEVTGRKVTFVDVPEEAMVEAAKASGAPPWLIEVLAGVFRVIRQGSLLAGTTGTVQAWLGRPPLSLGEWARTYAAQFAGRV